MKLVWSIALALSLAVPSPALKGGKPSAGPSQPPPASATQAMYQAAAESARRKFRHIDENGRRAHSDQTPTVLTEREINAYLSSGEVRLPKGVRSVRFTGQPDIVHAYANVDFDAITAGQRSANPLLGLFSGRHDVEVLAHASGSGHQGHVQIDSVTIDGVGVPRIALEYFVDHYVKPKHPNLGMDSTFQMPARIDIARVGLHTLTVTQK